MVRPRPARREDSSLRAVPAAARLEVAPDEELIRRIRAGDGWAEEALFRKYVDYINALALRLLRDRGDAEDVAQEVFMAAITRLRVVSEPLELRRWLVGIAVNKAHRRFRRRRLLALLGRRHTPEETVLATSGRAGTSPELLVELSLLDSALCTVSDVDRAAWTLRYVYGHSLDEVASLCECSLATAKRRILRTHRVCLAHTAFEGEAKHD